MCRQQQAASSRPPGGSGNPPRTAAHCLASPGSRLAGRWPRPPRPITEPVPLHRCLPSDTRPSWPAAPAAAYRAVNAGSERRVAAVANIQCEKKCPGPPRPSSPRGGPLGDPRPRAGIRDPHRTAARRANSVIQFHCCRHGQGLGLPGPTPRRRRPLASRANWRLSSLVAQSVSRAARRGGGAGRGRERSAGHGASTRLALAGSAALLRGRWATSGPRAARCAIACNFPISLSRQQGESKTRPDGPTAQRQPSSDSASDTKRAASARTSLGGLPPLAATGDTVAWPRGVRALYFPAGYGMPLADGNRIQRRQSIPWGSPSPGTRACFFLGEHIAQTRSAPR